MKKTNITIILLFVILNSSCLLYASGYHPPFDTAIKEAEVIVLGDVVEAWCPKDKRKPIHKEIESITDENGHRITRLYSENCEYGRIYRMKIKKVYKGSLKEGEEILIWDSSYRSTASYSIREDNKNLIFLKARNNRGYEKSYLDFLDRNVDFGVKIMPYVPIRNLSESTDFRSEEYNAWLFLLDTKIYGVTKDTEQEYRKILKTSNNKYILTYIISHWPKELNNEDTILFHTVIERKFKDASVTAAAVDKLIKDKKTLEKGLFVRLLKGGDPYLRNRLLPMVDQGNIEELKEDLFVWILDEDYQAKVETIEKLSAFCPEFFKKKLKETELPFWKMIPCLNSLKINGGDIGKEEYPKEVMGLGYFTLNNIGSVYQGKTFEIQFAMTSGYNLEDWEAGIKLLTPILKKPDSEIRRLVVAMIRTLGYEVKRENGVCSAKLENKVPCPLKIELKSTKQTVNYKEPLKMFVTEASVVDDLLISSDNRNISCTLSLMEKGAEKPKSDNLSIQGDIPELPIKDREKYTRLKKGEKTGFFDTVSFSQPGRYKVKLQLTYLDDGSKTEQNAWTGVVSSNEIEVEVTE